MTRAEELVRRVTAVDWRAKEHDFGHGAECARLLREYLRRAALWVRVLQEGREGDFFAAGQPDRWPFFDLARRVDPGVRADPELLARLDGFLGAHAGNPLTGRICRAALDWASLSPEALAPLAGMPDPFEPLVGVLEAGGGFWIENGFVDFVECRVRLGTWQEHDGTGAAGFGVVRGRTSVRGDREKGGRGGG
ncbi:hypothetical protein ACQKM2_33540 [Streptomyces sp. NPDC004126]|uniref:hypothetical protein n=1 Tax=Streptomyces sp. NPDC004126 TaxID=3390695 RepID=UPI003D05CCF7